jgi:hypothetical protein
MAQVDEQSQRGCEDADHDGPIPKQRTATAAKWGRMGHLLVDDEPG